jgi:hypothetical protein
MTKTRSAALKLRHRPNSKTQNEHTFKILANATPPTDFNPQNIFRLQPPRMVILDLKKLHCENTPDIHFLGGFSTSSGSRWHRAHSCMLTNFAGVIRNLRR